MVVESSLDLETRKSALCMVRMLLYLRDEAVAVLKDEEAAAQLEAIVRHLRARYRVPQSDLFPH